MKMKIKKYEIPEYLYNSIFYQALHNDHIVDDDKDSTLIDNDEIDIPENTMKLDLVLNTEDDLKYLLYTVRFWIKNTIPMQLIHFAINSTAF